MSPLSRRPRHAASTTSERATGPRRRQAQAPPAPAPRGADVVTQEYGAGDPAPYAPVRLDVRTPEPAGPQWTDPPPWNEPGTWTQPTTPWNGPTHWRDNAERWRTGGKSRRRWRTAQMLFRRRYNKAAIVTIAAVATVLFLLAAIPLAGNGRGAAAPAATGTVANAGPNATYRLVTYEAEAPGNTLVGSATVGAYQGASGGRLVRAIGNWGSPRGAGALRFTNVDVPKGGPYVLTFYFVNIGSNATRTAVVTASGSQSNPVTVVSDSLCCTAQPMVVFLSKGTNTITFSNSAGESPAIDRITLKVPLS